MTKTASNAIEVLTKQLQSKDLREQEYQDQIKALTEAIQAPGKETECPRRHVAELSQHILGLLRRQVSLRSCACGHRAMPLRIDYDGAL